MRIKRCLCAVLLAMATQVCISQTTSPHVFTSSGGYYSNASASLSWTMGEPLIETGSSQASIITQGFQQPTSIVISSVDNTPVSKVDVSAFPNPSASSVFVTTTSGQPIRVDVLSLEGKKLSSQSFTTSNNNEVNLSSYANGLYLLKVYTNDGQLLQTLKIEKIN